MSLGGVSCHPSGAAAPDADRGDGGRASADGDVVALPAASPCAAASPWDVEMSVGRDPTRVGFDPVRVVVFGAGTFVPLFTVEASGEGDDMFRCSEITVDAGLGASEVRVECQDGSQSKSAIVQLASGRLDVEVATDGAMSHQSVQVKPCARLVPKDLSMEPASAGSAAPNRCPGENPVRTVDAMLRRGKVDAKAGVMPLWLEVPALRLRRRIGQSASTDPGLCRSRVTGRGWAYVQCGAGEDASYVRIVSLPGEAVVETKGFGSGPRERIALPCDVRLALHELPCEANCSGP